MSVNPVKLTSDSVTNKCTFEKLILNVNPLASQISQTLWPAMHISKQHSFTNINHIFQRIRPFSNALKSTYQTAK